MDYEVARANMIEQQIRPWNVLQLQTLNALNEVRREDFVPDQYKNLAFADTQIPIGNGEVMLEPKVGARMIEALGLKPTQRILQIGTGTGYLTALLGTMCEHVTSVEIYDDLSAKAGMNLGMAGFTNIELVREDCFTYCENFNNSDSLFDGVLISGSVPEIDETFIKMVNEGGCVVGIEGHNPAMHVVVCQAGGGKQSLFETSVPRLVNVKDDPTFIF